MPPGLLARLRAAGYRASGRVGAGAFGPAWTVERLDGAPGRAVVRELTWEAADDDAVRCRISALRAARSDHLVAVADVVADVRHGCLLLVEEVPGPTLAAIVEARGALTAGEVVTLCVPLAQAIALLHSAGLVHGDVSPANVVIDAAGRPVLIDLWSAVVPGHDLGTPGFASPRVLRGEPSRPCDDVQSLARTCLWAWSDGAGADDGPADGDAEGAAALRALLEESAGAGVPGGAGGEDACPADAVELARRCFGAVVAQPLVVPEPAALARAEIVGAGRTARAVTVTRRARPAAGRRASRRRPTGRRVSGRRARARWRGRGVAAAVVLVLLGGAAVVSMTVRDGASRDTDPVAAAVALTEKRTAVIASGESERLAEVEVEDSPAFAADRAVMEGLHDEQVRIEGLTSEVTHAELLTAPSDSAATVAVTSRLSAHTRLAADGSILAATPQGQLRTVELALRLTATGWRVETVAEGQ